MKFVDVQYIGILKNKIIKLRELYINLKKPRRLDLAI
jgi:hypothetical protein